MDRRHSRIALVAALLLGTAALTAQTESPGTEAPPTVERDFRVFAVERKPIDGVFVTDADGADVELVFERKYRSEVYTYKGPPTMVFFRRSTGPEGAVVRTPVATAAIPAEVKEPLIFFMDAPQTEATDDAPATRQREFNLVWIDDSLQSFPYGTVRVLNACGAPLKGKIGPEAVSLGYETTPPLPTSRLRSGGSGWVNIGFAVKVQDEYELVYRNDVQFDDAARSILVLRPPRRPRSLRVDTYLIEEYMPPPEETAAGESL